MKLLNFFAAVFALLLLPFAAMAGTVTLESRGVAGVAGWSPVLVVRTNAGSTQVLGLPGVTYASAIDGTLSPNTILYSRNATVWASAAYGETMYADCTDRVGADDDGTGPGGGCSW